MKEPFNIMDNVNIKIRGRIANKITRLQKLTDATTDQIVDDMADCYIEIMKNNHDCKLSPDSGCNFCTEIEDIEIADAVSLMDIIH